MPSEMQVARDALKTSAPTAKTPLGRNQKVACWAYSVGAAIAMLPLYVTMAVALYRDNLDVAVMCVKESIAFAGDYGLKAVASILVVSGAIKGVGQVATMVGKWMDARKAEAEAKPQP